MLLSATVAFCVLVKYRASYYNLRKNWALILYSDEKLIFRGVGGRRVRFPNRKLLSLKLDIYTSHISNGIGRKGNGCS